MARSSCAWSRSFCLFVVAAAEVRLIYRRSGLLDLQEQRVAAAAALEEDQIYAHADAGHPHHLADHVNRREAVEQEAPIVPQGHPLASEELVGQRVLLVVVDGNAGGWVLVDPWPAVDHRGELGERAEVSTAPRLLLDVHRDPPVVGRCEVADQAVNMRAVAPEAGECSWQMQGKSLLVDRSQAVC